MIHLDPDEARQHKDERSRQFDVIQVPVLRCIGFFLVWLLVVARQSWDPSQVPTALGPLGSALFAYCLVTWGLLYLGSARPGLALPLLFLGLDAVVYSVVIYLTGAEQSWLWVLLLTRIADQTNTSFRRVLGFLHWNCFCFLVVLYVASTREPAFQWGTAGVKVMTLYGIGMYLSLTARTAESLRSQTRSAIRVAQEQLRLRQRLAEMQELILASAQDGILSVDAEGHCTLINPAALQALGVSADELTGLHIHWILHRLAQHEPCPLMTGRSEINREDVFWRKNGEAFPVEYSSAPLLDEDEVVGIVFVFRDVTLRSELARLKDEFISTVSHELRTPLTSIRGSLGLLLGGLFGQLTERGQHMLEVAVNNTDRLVRLINDILDIEKLSSGQVVLDKAAHPAEAVVQMAVDSVQGAAQKQGVEVVSEVADVTVLADGDRIVQVLTNLIGNAVKFSPRDAKVLVQVAPRDGDVAFSVQDHGRGIPQEKLGIIFDRFQQVDASDARDKGGTGLGLAISRAIVEQHDGTIWVESKLGEGSTFAFSLPRPHPE